MSAITEKRTQEIRGAKDKRSERDTQQNRKKEQKQKQKPKEQEQKNRRNQIKITSSA